MMVLWEEKYIRWRGVGEIESISLSLPVFPPSLSRFRRVATDGK